MIAPITIKDTYVLHIDIKIHMSIKDKVYSSVNRHLKELKNIYLMDQKKNEYCEKCKLERGREANRIFMVCIAMLS